MKVLGTIATIAVVAMMMLAYASSMAQNKMLNSWDSNFKAQAEYQAGADHSRRILRAGVGRLLGGQRKADIRLTNLEAGVAGLQKGQRKILAQVRDDHAPMMHGIAVGLGNQAQLKQINQNVDTLTKSQGVTNQVLQKIITEIQTHGDNVNELLEEFTQTGCVQRQRVCMVPAQKMTGDQICQARSKVAWNNRGLLYFEGYNRGGTVKCLKTPGYETRRQRSSVQAPKNYRPVAYLPSAAVRPAEREFCRTDNGYQRRVGSQAIPGQYYYSDRKGRCYVAWSPPRLGDSTGDDDTSSSGGDRDSGGPADPGTPPGGPADPGTPGGGGGNTSDPSDPGTPSGGPDTSGGPAADPGTGE